MNILMTNSPSDLFDCEDPQSRYRELARKAHPDAGGSSQEFTHLQQLWERWKTAQSIQMDDYWELGKYKVANQSFVVGEHANFYKVHDPDHPERPLCLRMPRSGRDGSSSEKILKITRSVSIASNVDFTFFMPRVYNIMNVGFDNGHKRKSLLMQRMVGWSSLETVLKEVGPLHILDSAWIIRRLFAILGAFQEADKVHSNINLQHVMIEPVVHGLVVCGMSQTKQGRDYSIDSEAAKNVALAITDMSTVPRQMQVFMRNMDVKPVPHLWQLRMEFDQMLMKGTKDRLRFREFNHNITTVQ